MNTLGIAARNITRNVRRSLMTMLAIAIGATAMLLFGAYVAQIFVQIETQNVIHSGHLAVFRAGYFKYGTGNPAAYGIADYEGLIQRLSDDPELKPLIRVITPTINLYGIAGNFDAEASRTFFGVGVVPADYNRMLAWDEHGVRTPGASAGEAISETDPNHGFIGVGLGRILKLCGPLNIADCPREAAPERATQAGNGINAASGGASGSEAMVKAAAPARRDFSDLAEPPAPGAAAAGQGSATPGSGTAVRIDLLAATAQGAPNVVDFHPDKAVRQGARELDDAFVAMNFRLAQQLLYGRGGREATSVVLQLNHTSDTARVRARIDRMIHDGGLDLETRDLKELQPFYPQVLAMFGAIFSFIAVVMAMIVLFTVVNTMSMSVMERTPEIGTLRAIGVRRHGITTQFVCEGLLLGVIGASAGVVFGYAAAWLVNHAGLTWMPPGNANPIPLLVRTHGLGLLTGGIWAALVLMAVVAAWFPARRGARMTIVDALGHV